jgi:hypothetical protein
LAAVPVHEKACGRCAFGTVAGPNDAPTVGEESVAPWTRQTDPPRSRQQARKKGNAVKPLSEQLTELSAEAKKVEDFVAAAQAKNRAALDSQREQLRSRISDSKARAEARGAAAEDKAQSWWADTRSTIDARLAGLRDERDLHRAERDLKKAERRAEDAEQDAAYAVEFAIEMLDQAEYAVADAVIARADADDLVSNQAG